MNDHMAPWYRTGYGKWMIIAPILVTVVSAAIGSYVIRKRTNCERAAAGDLYKLAAAWERVGNELEDLGCDPEIAVPSEQLFKCLHGPYYGWGGTSYRCFTLISLNGATVGSCSMNGRIRDLDKRKRTIYRYDLKTGKELPSIVRTCEGKEYARRGDQLYVSSMIEKVAGQCRFVEPKTAEERY